MTHWKRIGAMLVATGGLLGMSLFVPSVAEAHGERGESHEGMEFHHGFRPHVTFGFGIGPYWGAPYWGWGAPYWGWWGPGWGPYWGGSYYPEGGVSMSQALVAGYGAIKFDVKPKQAEVWADGKYVAEARDLDGNPSYLWLKAGEHAIEIYDGGYANFNQKVDVRAGMRTDLKVRLEPGQSVPPTPPAPESKTPEPEAPGSR
jgi:hypothetical protein